MSPRNWRRGKHHGGLGVTDMVWGFDLHAASKMGEISFISWIGSTTFKQSRWVGGLSIFNKWPIDIAFFFFYKVTIFPVPGTQTNWPEVGRGERWGCVRYQLRRAVWCNSSIANPLKRVCRLKDVGRTVEGWRLSNAMENAMDKAIMRTPNTSMHINPTSKGTQFDLWNVKSTALEKRHWARLITTPQRRWESSQLHGAHIWRARLLLPAEFPSRQSVQCRNSFIMFKPSFSGLNRHFSWSWSAHVKSLFFRGKLPIFRPKSPGRNGSLHPGQSLPTPRPGGGVPHSRMVLRYFPHVRTRIKTGWWWLVAIFGIFPDILGISSSQLTNSYFSEGWPNHQPEKHWCPKFPLVGWWK